jgi:hypothetical protein
MSIVDVFGAVLREQKMILTAGFIVCKGVLVMDIAGMLLI